MKFKIIGGLYKNMAFNDLHIAPFGINDSIVIPEPTFDGTTFVSPMCEGCIG